MAVNRMLDLTVRICAGQQSAASVTGHGRYHGATVKPRAATREAVFDVDGPGQNLSRAK